MAKFIELVVAPNQAGLPRQVKGCVQHHDGHVRNSAFSQDFLPLAH
jgi:hypothetical protein